jgi:hypothetical protein
MSAYSLTNPEARADITSWSPIFAAVYIALFAWLGDVAIRLGYQACCRHPHKASLKVLHGETMILTRHCGVPCLSST